MRRSEFKIKHPHIDKALSVTRVVTHSDHSAVARTGDAFGVAALLLSSASLIITCGFGIFANFTHILGRTPSAISGATILALSLLVSVVTASCLLAMNRRSVELARLLDELDETEEMMSDAKATATRIRAFRAKIAAQDTFN